MSSNPNQAPQEELTTEQRRKLIRSIRENGRIRPIPADSTAEISYEDILPGDDMTNFHDEFAHGRYYRRENFLKLMNSNPVNPHTREPIEKFHHYIASVNGNTGGRDIVRKVLIYIDIFQNEIEFHQTENIDEESNIEENEGYSIVNPAKPFHYFISKFIEDEASHTDILPINKYIAFFGIRDGETSFLVKPLEVFIDQEHEHPLLRAIGDIDENNHEELATYLSQPLSSLLGNRDGMLLKSVRRTPLSQNLELPYPSDIIRTPQEKQRFQREWNRIKQTIYNDIVNLFHEWLRSNHNQYQAFTEFKLTPEISEFTRKIRAEVDELARNEAIRWKEEQSRLEREARQKQRYRREQEERDFNNRYEQYYKRFGGVRKTRRFRKVSKKTLRKNKKNFF